MMDFDVSSSYPSANCDENTVYLEIETGFGFEPLMNNIYVEAINNQTFNQDGNESAILWIKYYNPANPLFQYLTIKEKVKNIEVNVMRNGYIIDTLASFHIQEIVKIGEE